MALHRFLQSASLAAHGQAMHHKRSELLGDLVTDASGDGEDASLPIHNEHTGSKALLKCGGQDQALALMGLTSFATR